jgi:RNA polymerase sigma-70 factor, ECF subfamily
VPPDPGPLEREVAALYAEHARALFRYALVLVRTGEPAQDAVQDVFLRYFVTRSAGEPIEAPKAWLFRVLRNHLLDILKSSSNRFEVNIDEVRQSPDHRLDPEASYSRVEIVRRAWSTLAPRELECLRLRAEGLSYSEIADVLSVRQGTVGALLARAQKKFRQALTQAGPAGYSAAAREAGDPV